MRSSREFSLVFFLLGFISDKEQVLYLSAAADAPESEKEESQIWSLM